MTTENGCSIDEQKQTWIEEQLKIAALVEILQDEEEDGVGRKNGRFRMLDLHAHKTRHDNNNVYYGGVDVSFPENDSDPAVAVYTIIDARTMTNASKPVYTSHAYFHLTVPYVPSFLAFREIEPLHRLVEEQRTARPDLTPRAILMDGNGILHSRRAGIACFLGVRTGIPTIGVGKNLFCEGGLSRKKILTSVMVALDAAVQYLKKINKGDTKALKEKERGCGRLLIDRQTNDNKQMHVSAMHDAVHTIRGQDDRSALFRELREHSVEGLAIPLRSDTGEILAAALVGHGGGKVERGLRGAVGSSSQRRSSIGSQKAIFVSVGHKISLQHAVQICADISLARIPEPIRQADLIGRDLLRQRRNSGAGGRGERKNERKKQK
jgi:deoxyinosine 3'endonuclease (endonuclease V)